MKPKFITVHCSATRPKHSFTVDRLRDLHVKVNGWSAIGYHFYITTDGILHPCRPLTRNGAHVSGHNADNIGVCLEGGLDNATGKPANTYNTEQMSALKQIVEHLQNSFGIDDAQVCGHRDWYGEKKDWKKECPCFDVHEWMKNN